MDWADEITAKIDLQMQATWNVAPIAAALRKAKADGMREAADMFCAEYENGISTFSTYDTVYAAASKLTAKD